MQDTHIDESLTAVSLELLQDTCAIAEIPLEDTYRKHPLMQAMLGGDQVVVDIYYGDIYDSIQKALSFDTPITATQTEHADNISEETSDKAYSAWLTQYTEVRWWDVNAGCVYKEQTPNIVALIGVMCSGLVLDSMHEHVKALN